MRNLLLSYSHVRIAILGVSGNRTFLINGSRTNQASPERGCRAQFRWTRQYRYKYIMSSNQSSNKRIAKNAISLYLHMLAWWYWMCWEFLTMEYLA